MTPGQTGVQTSSGLAGLIILALLLLLVFHFVGFRVLFTAGRGG
jgi:hypothetical protein